MFKRAVGIGIVVFILSLIINAVIAKILDIDIKTTMPKDLPAMIWLAGIIGALVSSIGGSLWFFHSRKILANANNGFIFGVIICILGFILDIVALLPYKNGLALLTGYYLRIEYWAAFIIIILSSILVGYLKSKKI